MANMSHSLLVFIPLSFQGANVVSSNPIQPRFLTMASMLGEPMERLIQMINSEHASDGWLVSSINARSLQGAVSDRLALFRCACPYLPRLKILPNHSRLEEDEQTPAVG